MTNTSSIRIQQEQNKKTAGYSASYAIKLAIFFCLLITGSFCCSKATAKVRPYSKTRTLQNGLRLNLAERTDQPLVEFKILIRAGSKYDPAGKSGLASVTARLLREGAGSRDDLAFQRLIDSIGVDMQINVTRDIIDISVTVLRKELLTGTRLIRDLLLEQHFSVVSFERQLQRSLAAINQATDVGETAISNFAYRRFFPHDAYGAAPHGSLEQLNSITLEDVKAFYKRFYQPDRISIIIAGDISAKDYINKIHEALSPYHKNKHVEKDTPTQPERSQSDSLEIYILDTPEATGDAGDANGAGGAGAKIGFFALCDSASDTRPFSSQLMVSHLLAGFPEFSFLGRRLVAKVDLVSNLRAELKFSPAPTLMEIQMDCTNDRVVEVVHETLEALKLLRETRISKRELEEGKNFFRAFYDLGFETPKNVTERFAELQRANLSYKGHDTLLYEMNLLGQSDIRETSAKIFAPSHLIVVIRGHAQEFAESLASYGKVEIIPSRKPKQ